MASPNATALTAGISATIQLFRIACDSIVVASKAMKKDAEKLEQKKKDDSNDGKVERKFWFSNNRVSSGSMLHKKQVSYGSMSGHGSAKSDDVENGGDAEDFQNNTTKMEQWMPMISLISHAVILGYLMTILILEFKKKGKFTDLALHGGLLECAVACVLFGLVMNIRDFHRLRFSFFQRVLYVLSTLVLLVSATIVWIKSSTGAITNEMQYADSITLFVIIYYFALSITESKISPYPIRPKTTEGKKGLSRKAIFIILKPYFWPDATATSAALNRARALFTWICVILAKICNLTAPIFIGWATAALTHFDYYTSMKYSVIYSVTAFFGSMFRECQSLVYLKVAQAAFVQLSEVSFHHLHCMSLDWHLRKKLGEVIRSMDRGISACDTLMKYLFLWLVPALAECLLVCIIFATYFNYFPVAVTVFFFVFFYIFITIIITLWRKKFRTQVAKSDNDWHDKCTDSLVNFETVKCFTAEIFEMKRFGDAVKTYQSGSVNVQASLSLLNILQQVVFRSCLAIVLCLTALGVKQRFECCVANGCEAGLSSCCSDIVGLQTCPGMDIGDFVAVLTYTINLFMPLNFLGSVYNAIVMATVDLTNLSELLAESPDIVDAQDAMPLPEKNYSDEDVAVEFENVSFHYPTQNTASGLKGLSFKMKKGTVTAVVGPTGAGKTTVSRLLFRFYDVLGGCVKVNGQDVRTITQKSLRGAIGVVPQNTTLFNDTIRENIRYGRRDATQEELEAVARDARLDSFIATLPDGWDTLVGDRGLKLSGGEKQRVAIARCLLKNPPFIVLDEATSALDTVTESSVQEALDRLDAGRTCLVIAHRLGTIKNADNIIVVSDGKVLEQGTHEYLLQLGGKYAEMWNMQLHSTSSLMS